MPAELLTEIMHAVRSSLADLSDGAEPLGPTFALAPEAARRTLEGDREPLLIDAGLLLGLRDKTLLLDTLSLDTREAQMQQRQGQQDDPRRHGDGLGTDLVTGKNQQAA